MIETGPIEAISEDFCGSDAASAVEKELKVTSVTGSVGVCDGFGVAERVKERAECAYLVSNFRLPFGVGRESEELVYEEGGAEALSGACDPPLRNVSAKTRIHNHPKAMARTHLKMTDCDWFLRLMTRYTLAANSYRWGDGGAGPPGRGMLVFL